MKIFRDHFSGTWACHFQKLTGAIFLTGLD